MIKTVYLMLAFTLLFNGRACFVDLYSQDYISSVWVESMPVFKGDLVDFVRIHINYPKQALSDSIEGVVFIYCWVDTTGITTNHVVLKGVRDDLNQEALRVSRLVKFSKPAIQNGKPICVKYTIPVIFKLPTKKDSQCKKR